MKSKSEAKHKAINMAPQPPLREAERDNWNFFLKIPEVDRRTLSLGQVKDVQLLQPLFEFSGACAGCGETPYIKLMSQLYRRPGAHLQRHRLLVDLRRQSTHHPLRTERRRARPGVDELLV